MSCHSANKSDDAVSLMVSEGESLFGETIKNNANEEAHGRRRVHYDSDRRYDTRTYDEQKTEEIWIYKNVVGGTIDERNLPDLHTTYH